MDKEFIKNVIDNGELLTIDTFGDPIREPIIEIMTKKYNDDVYYIREEDYKIVEFKKLI